jgi:3-oxoacyl-[acyl-carrier-protein] synthase III
LGGAVAIVDGIRHLRSGRAERVLVAAADVASPLLQRLLDGAPLRDGAAALVLERGGDARARGAAIRGWVIAVGAAHAAGRRPDGVARAAGRALAAAALEPAAIGSLIGVAADVAAARALCPPAALAPFPADTLGAAPLVAATGWLASGRGAALLVAGDPAGSGVAAVLAGAT